VADQTSEPLAVQIQSLLHQIEASAIAGGPLGGLFLLMTALTLFVNFERCFGIIWERADRAQGFVSNFRALMAHRLRGFVMLLMIACLIFINFVSYFVIEWVARWLQDFGSLQRWWQLTHLGSSLSLNALLFTVIYRTLPRQRIHWWAAMQGGVLAAITWEIGRYLLAWLIISDKYHTFGVVGVFMGLMMWAYYGTYVVLLGATLTRVTSVAREAAIRQRRLEREGAGTDSPTTLPFRPAEAYRRRIPLDEGPRRHPPARQVA
jgi:membrane protein